MALSVRADIFNRIRAGRIPAGNQATAQRFLAPKARHALRADDAYLGDCKQLSLGHAQVGVRTITAPVAAISYLRYCSARNTTTTRYRSPYAFRTKGHLPRDLIDSYEKTLSRKLEICDFCAFTSRMIYCRALAGLGCNTSYLMRTK